MKIEKILTYPVKALRAVELDSAEVTNHGFPHDRRFMVLEVQQGKNSEPTTYKNIHVADYPQSILFHPILDLTKGLVTIHHKPPGGQGKSTTFPLRPQTDDLEIVDVEMHKSPTKAYKMPQHYSDWFSQCYGFEVVLAYLGVNYRPVLMSSSHNKQPKPNDSWLSSITNTLFSAADEKAQITFADCAPYLIVSSTSLLDLHPRLSSAPQDETKMDILKFRPNIIVSGAEDAWDEDFWAELTFPSSNVKISCVHNCGRCKSTNIDYSTGKPGTGPSGEMLKRMQKDRRVDPGMKYSPIFGRYSFLASGEGETIEVGDEVVVSRRLEERSVFDWEGLSTA